MDPRTRNMLIFGGVLIGLLVVLKVGNKKLRRSEKVAPAAESLSEGSAPVAANHKQKSAGSPKSEAEALNYPEIRRSRVGLNTVSYVTDKDGATALKVDVKSTHVCHAADFEAIKALVGDRGQVLLALEPVNGGDKPTKAASRTLSLDSLAEGVTVDLPVNNKRAGIYGLYLCSDRAGKGSCVGKSPADFNELTSRPVDSQTEDAIFFFQFVVIQEPDAQLYSGAITGLSRVRDELLNQGMKDQDVRPALKRASSLMRETASLPPNTINVGEVKTIQLPIAMFDKAVVCK